MSETEEFEFRLRLEKERGKGQAAPAASAPPADEPFPVKLGRVVRDVGAGAIRGAGSIGATLMVPVDAGARALGIQNDYIGRTDRREGMTGALGELGADTDSLAFSGGKLAGEIAGTAGAGGVLAKGAQAVGAAPRVVNALASSGFRTGAAPAAGDLAVRSAAGAVAGGAQAGLSDPSSAGAGTLVGGALPGGVKAGGAIGGWVGGKAADAANWTAERLMQSALKPTIEQLRNGQAAIAVRTLLDHGINATGAGVNKLKALIEDKNNEISNMIGGSSATVDKNKVLATLGDTRQRFGNQVSPTNDLNAIAGVEADFLNHPNLPGQAIPVQDAQKLKQGTYRVLKGKYGEQGSAQTEAQKALARGLKEEIATAVPGVGALNAEESRLLATLTVAERRALMDMNKNPMGLAALAGNPISWAAFMADRSAAFKSLAARFVNSATPSGNALQRLSNLAPGQLTYRAAPVVAGDQ